MSTEVRQELIQRLAEMRSSHVITYVTSTRENLESQMSMDVIPIIYRHGTLKQSPRTQHSFVRSFERRRRSRSLATRNVAPTVLQRADSRADRNSATLLALGADRVRNHPMETSVPLIQLLRRPSTLQPPPPPTQSARKLGVSVKMLPCT